MLTSRFNSDLWDGKDLLGRESFAKSLAQQIQAWKKKESLVVGLYGEWGNGKTVAKDMALQQLRANPSSCPLILEFNSWEWSGHDRMTTALFSQIRATLGKEDSGEAANKAAAIFKSYEAYLKTVVIGLEGISSATDSLMKIAAVVAFGVSTTFSSTIVKSIGFMLGGILLLLPLLKFSVSLLNSMAEANANEAERNKKTLEEIKTELAEQLLKLDKPLLIIIDDIDRLSADEIKVLFQLVKANVNFPNIIYFLIFQKDLIESALEETFKVASGKEYLKKIVQVGFDLPAIERRRLNDYLKQELLSLVSANGLSVDSARLSEAFEEGFDRMFKNLRDINRFLVSLEFHLGLFTQNGGLEVDCIDLAILVAIRQFEEVVYQKVPTVRNKLLRESANHFTKDEVKDEEYKDAIDLLVNSADEANRQIVKDAISLLFPASYHANVQNINKWFREFRICDSDGFDRYFLLSVPIGAVAKSEVVSIKAAVGHADQLGALFEQYHKQHRLYDLLRYLNASIEEIDNANILPIFTALFNSENYFERSTSELGWVTFTTADISQRIIRGFLSQIPDVKNRGALLLKAIQGSNCVYLPVKIVGLEVSQRARYPDNCVLTEGDLPLLKQACLVKIVEWSKSAHAVNHSQLAEILAAWKSWDTKSDFALWIERVIATKEGLLDYLHAFLSGVELNTPFTNDRLLEAMRFLEYFGSLDKIVAQVKHLGVSSKDHNSISLFEAGLTLKKTSDLEQKKIGIEDAQDSPTS